MKLNLSFDDVLIVPQFSSVKSRKDVKTTTTFLGEEIFPVISSNMASVTEAAMAKAMADYGARGCLHRFMSVDENVKQFVTVMQNIGRPLYVSLGLGDLELERAAALANVGATHFVIDVAHGASMEVVRQTKALKHIVGKDSYIVVGNFATGRTVKDFTHHLGSNIDAIKVGIGGGANCTTRVVTGVGMPTLSSVIDCHSAGIPIIADGGIRGSADFAKALAAGASAIMVGKILAGSNESSAPTTTRGYKLHSGSASTQSYKAQGKESKWRTPEGDTFTVANTGPVHNVLNTLESGLRSAMSYVGATNLTEFQERAELVQITESGIVESQAHGKLKNNE